jgi:hypothetical protein
VAGIGAESCPVNRFVIKDVEPSDSATTKQLSRSVILRNDLCLWSNQLNLLFALLRTSDNA